MPSKISKPTPHLPDCTRNIVLTLALTTALAEETPPPPTPATAPTLLDAIRQMQRNLPPGVPIPPAQPATPTAVAPAATTPPAAQPVAKPLPVETRVKPASTTAAKPVAASPAAAPPTPAATATTSAPATQTVTTIEPIAPRDRVLTQQPQLVGAGGVTLRFDNADVYEVVQTIMGDILQLNYIVDPGITGKVNINGLSPVSSEDLLGVLQSVLALNNISIIRDGNLYKVVRDNLAARDTVSSTAVGDNGSVVQIFAPRHVQPSALIATLRNFIGPQATLVNDPTDHYLIVVDRARNVKKLQELVQSLDIDYLAKVQTEMVQIENGDATEVAREMETLFKTSQMYNWRGTEANKVFFMPIKRMNAILVAASNRDVLEAARKQIREVDIAPKEGLNSRINIYTVKNSTAAYLAGLISQIYGGAAPASSSGATKVVQKGNVPTTSASGTGLSGEVQIIPNEKSNSLIIKASRQDYLQILQLLEQLDTVSRQVLIQANVIEVGLSKQNRLGIEWTLLHEKLSIDGQIYKAAAKLGGTIDAKAGGLLYSVTDSVGTAMGAIQAVANDDDITILASPRIVASDGKEAKIEIGQEVPVRTQQISNANTGTTGSTIAESFTYRTVGIILQVKPSINESGLVNLEINQEVSTVANDTNGATTLPRFTKRSVQTEVSLQEGKTLVIGGLIQDNGSVNETGVPYLKDIPVLGNLFRAQTKKTERTELLLTLTPYVINNQSDADRLNRQLDDAMEEVRELLNTARRQKAGLPPTLAIDAAKP